MLDLSHDESSNNKVHEVTKAYLSHKRVVFVAGCAPAQNDVCRPPPPGPRPHTAVGLPLHCFCYWRDSLREQ
ncbi:hypothetical protein EVAR_71209_1 [Eumeta japonica]|uniref:Uncharacterized protein n=1 Tax=Eumeta variegata TaxID=151549 RepID=A0A4C2A124_EUMVA|nr:hypothetical protein EVAR_71209_1 [Eumeta japonica]